MKLTVPIIVCATLSACASAQAPNTAHNVPGDASYRQPALGDAANRIPKGTDSPGNVTGGPLD